ncbi:helix-turn-helix domain-containing protein [Clostridium gasigenes]|uniref:Helix-turn-helix transcriptional regulator n=1 Tax=Clostridium gasigenes TaxID=94869 RepID=A0A7X0VSY9_9CLOT|nr:helix-turn-helix transcriptional regulator [Clostridium gasigenes]MBB6716220.1 helix-turn-helix transcriptional regulator [Clostridium gasigenes]
MFHTLTSFRIEEDLTQKEMATRIGTTLTFYSKIEMGLRNPSYNFLSKFKESFPKSSIDLIFFKTNNHL